MKGWFDTLRLGAIALFLLVMGGWMVVEGFTRGAEWEEFRKNGAPARGRVISLSKSTEWLVKTVHRAEVEYSDGRQSRRASVKVYKKDYSKLSQGAAIDVFISPRDPARVRAASRFKNDPLSIGGVRVDPIAFVAIFNLGLGGFLAWMMVGPWIDSARASVRRKNKVARGRASNARPVRLVDDSSAGLASGAELLPLVKERKWPELSARLAASDKGLLRTIDDLVETEGFPEWLDEWAKAEPKSAMPWLMRGIRRVGWAWEARSTSRAEEVDPEAWPVFYERLEDAECDLARAAALDPSDARPWIRLITVAKGLSMPLGERLVLLEEATSRVPHSFDAHMAYLDSIAEKWGGSHQASLAHARRIAEDAPASSGLAALLADVHFEIAATCESMEGYFELPEVGEELRGAAEKCKAIRAPWLRRRAAASFAFCFWQAGLLEEAKEQFTRSEGYVCGIWASYGEPAPLYERAWRECA